MVIHNKRVVEDFPEDYLKSIAIDSRQPYMGPWKITLKPYILQPFMGMHPSYFHLKRNVKFSLKTKILINNDFYFLN